MSNITIIMSDEQLRIIGNALRTHAAHDQMTPEVRKDVIDLFELAKITYHDHVRDGRNEQMTHGWVL
jgi:hypothetical protein